MTTEKITCPACKGGKTVRGMGGMIRDCSNCSGKGSVDVPVSEEVVVVTASAVAKNDTVKTTVAPDAKIEVQYSAADKSDVTPTAEVVITPEVKPSVEVVGEAPRVEQVEEKPAKPIEQELGEMAGYTPFMIEAIMKEPSMKPDVWRNKYASVICNPLAMPKPGVKYLPDLQSRARFRESVARSQKPAKRKHDTMKTHDLAGKLEGLE